MLFCLQGFRWLKAGWGGRGEEKGEEELRAVCLVTCRMVTSVPSSQNPNRLILYLSVV